MVESRGRTELYRVRHVVFGDIILILDTSRALMYHNKHSTDVPQQTFNFRTELSSILCAARNVNLTTLDYFHIIVI